MDRKRAPVAPAKRWDGAARACADWDNLHRDPELWFRNGNCLVHLYAKGQSNRGPSFKLPFSTLLDKRCFPLIERYIAWEGIRVPKARELVKWSRKNPSRLVELYVPPPSLANKMQAFHHHLAIRNFLAWVFRRSLVGDSLGGAIVGLLHSMHELRSSVKDNVADMMDYLDEEGYLDMSNQPSHALAMLYLSEFFQMHELYTRAFAHCVGMSDQLFDSTGYQHISSKSKQLIRKARSETDTRLRLSTTMLKTFLDDELSESHLAISSGARAHLERFRSFLLSFYAAKLGYYPPRSVNSRNDIFDVKIYGTMRQDFEALYELLVDDKYTASEVMPPVAAGGICTIQLTYSFDSRYAYDALEHPLPLIPETRGQVNARRMAWLSRREGSRLNTRLVAQASLMRASNLLKPEVLQNDLVRAYQRFEEQSIIASNKLDRREKVSIVDARKVRWILIYAIYQVILSATTTPPEVVKDQDQADYSLSVSTANIPPWTQAQEMGRQTDLAINTSSQASDAESSPVDSPQRIEIKPDIDYFALTHKDPGPQRRDSAKVISETRSSLSSRSSSLSHALSRSSAIRRSMQIFKSPSSTPPQAATLPHRPSYHEIVVHGYGNGTNNVNIDGEVEFGRVSWAESSTTSSALYSAEEDAPQSLESVDNTPGSSIKTPSPAIDTVEIYSPTGSKLPRQKRRDVVSMVTRSLSGTSLTRERRPASAMFPDRSKQAEYEQAGDEHRQSVFRSDSVLSRSLSRHSMIFPDLKRKSFLPDNRSTPVQAQTHEPDIDEEPYILPDDADWTAMQAFMDNEGCQVEMVDDDVMPAWEQYADLGGLTEMR